MRSSSTHRSGGPTARSGRSSSPGLRPGPGAFALALAALCCGAPALAAQSASQILGDALARHEARLSGIQDLTLRQEVMGFPTTAYMVKEMVDGRPVLSTQAVDVVGTGIDAGDLSGDLWGDPGRFYDEWVDRWSLEGRVSAPGGSAWRLTLTDFDGLQFPGTVPGQDLPFSPTRMVLDLDEAQLVPVAITMEGEAIESGTARPVEVHIRFSDYRDVGGYLHPFLSVVETDMAAAGMSPQDLEQARAGLEELRRQLEQVTPAQREMMERMMGGQIDSLEEMLGGDTLRLEIRVTDVQVNTGPPATR